jgi:hypothetical protein
MRGGNHVIYVPESHIANELGRHLKPLHLDSDVAGCVNKNETNILFF